MDIQVTTRHAKVSAGARATVEEKLEKLERYIEKITSCHVVLDNEHNDWLVEITMLASGHTFAAKAHDDNMGKALDDVVDKLERQIKKINEKIKTHKAPKPEIL